MGESCWICFALGDDGRVERCGGKSVFVELDWRVTGARGCVVSMFIRGTKSAPW